MPENTIGVLGLGAYVPESVMTNDEWAEHVDTSDEWIIARTGIKNRRIAAEDQTTVDLAAAAAERALADAKTGPPRFYVSRVRQFSTRGQNLDRSKSRVKSKG